MALKLDLKPDSTLVIDLGNTDVIDLAGGQVRIRLEQKPGQRYRGMARLEISADKKIPVRVERPRLDGPRHG